MTWKLLCENCYVLTGIGIFVIVIVLYLTIFKKKLHRRLKATLVQKNSISHDTQLFTFVLPNDKQPLGLKIGQHVEITAKINNEVVKRKYTPISRYNKKGSFDLLIKVYRKCQKFKQGGKMSQYLDLLQLSQQIDIELPFGKVNYLGNKQFLIKNVNSQIQKKFQNIYLIGGGTGITPLYQIIQYVSEEEDISKKPNIILLFANKTQSDILLEKELKQFQKINPKFKVYFSVDVPQKQTWTGFRGFIDKDKINSTLPTNVQQTIFISCGPPIMCSLVQKILSTIKVPFDQIHRF